MFCANCAGAPPHKFRTISAHLWMPPAHLSHKFSGTCRECPAHKFCTILSGTWPVLKICLCTGNECLNAGRESGSPELLESPWTSPEVPHTSGISKPMVCQTYGLHAGRPSRKNNGNQEMTRTKNTNLTAANDDRQITHLIGVRLKHLLHGFWGVFWAFFLLFFL